METKDIIHNLNAAAVSKNGIPNELLLDIDAALKERDELRQKAADQYEQIGDLQSKNFILYGNFENALGQLSQEREGFDALRTLLSSIRDSAECMPVPGGHVYTVDGAMMGQIDKALGVTRQ